MIGEPHRKHLKFLSGVTVLPVLKKVLCRFASATNTPIRFQDGDSGMYYTANFVRRVKDSFLSGKRMVIIVCKIFPMLSVPGDSQFWRMQCIAIALEPNPSPNLDSYYEPWQPDGISRLRRAIRSHIFCHSVSGNTTPTFLCCGGWPWVIDSLFKH